ncbi:DUF1801 domain-containing protein [Vibrio lentus]|uniref:DUF1801 domain-containing protein n=1 Tax=Vibrio lentus TaxID=136468 RepID=A0A4U2EEG0_9VIBR|nr:DUF1801 domain-containing protein [Vibrio lentus]MCC4784651.1 DUF1801 domain-containing protein [Vibrio lentus]PMI95405.1 hypothetical protein BCU33_11955 [Vibrio lentus]PMJ07564.1 hypothetical protein BCU31_24015 [Vibrio lentus]PML07821.1 hypothetical protein BCT85_21115 [Vibrio lentus]TKF56065.1 DUF1801 domain-containing protein [Vibrio lentus]
MDKAVKNRFEEYPENARVRLVELRELILKISLDLQLGEVEESLKWGELSYSVKTGSPIRIDWKLKTPNNYYLYFHCQTKLVDTFRELHGDVLRFQGNRAIELRLSDPLPEPEIKQCLELALTYHQRKHLPLLGT